MESETLEECIARAIREHFSTGTSESPYLVGLDRPVLRVEAFLEDASQSNGLSKAKKLASVRLLRQGS